MSHLAGKADQSRGRSLLIITAMVTLIGWVDYLTGPRFSLGFLYLVPIAFSVARLGWRFGSWTAVVSMAVRIWGDIASGPYLFPRTAYWNRFVDLVMDFVIIWVLHAFIMLHRELESRVQERTRDLQLAMAARDELQHQLFEISRRERSSIGHDLHDGLGQHLTATAMAAELLSEHLHARRDAGAEEARTIVRLIEEGIAKTRHIARGLLLSAIEPGQLPVELEELAATVSREQRVPCSFTDDGTARAIDTATASHLFYIAREAIHNAVRHARPSRLEVWLFSDATSVTLSVTDDGSGLPSPNAPKSGMGLRIMAHRAELMGAQFSLESSPGGGTVVRCRVPLPQFSAAVTASALAASPRP